MSDTYLRVFPADPNYAPPQAARERTLALVTKFFPRAAEIKEELSDHPVFIDPGGNWDGVECPRCGQDLGGWWPTAMDRAWETKFSDLRVKTPCCGLETALNELRYRWPVGFGRYYISVLYPDRDLDEADLHEVELALGTPVKQLYARYWSCIKTNEVIMSQSQIESRNSQIPTDVLRQLDKRHLWHPFTPMKLWNESDPLVIVAAEGMHLIDSDGNRYLDGVSSLWCNVHGHQVPEIDQAIRDQLGKVAHTTMLGLASEPAILLADRLMKIVPQGLTKVFYSDAGATATEIAFKLAAQYWFNVGRPEKNEFVGFAEAYHGDTVGAMSIGRIPAFHKPYFPMLFKVHFAPTPYVYRHPKSDDPEAVMDDCLAQLESILKANASRLAAICIEPVVQGAGGIIVQPRGFLGAVRELASQYDVLLIADEVATGFGRTGRMFACEHEGVSPDLMCVAKGITGGYLPLAATFATQPIFDAFLGEPWQGKTFYHGHTYTGNPLACAAALASLNLFERNNLVASVATKARPLSRMLDDLRPLPHVGDIRQRGFMVGIELVEEKRAKRAFDPKRRVGAEVCARVRKHGVIIRPLGDVVVLMPPLAMGVDDLGKIVDAVKVEISNLS